MFYRRRRLNKKLSGEDGGRAFFWGGATHSMSRAPTSVAALLSRLSVCVFDAEVSMGPVRVAQPNPTQPSDDSAVTRVHFV